MQISNGIIIAPKSEVQLFLSIRNNVVHFDNIMRRIGERNVVHFDNIMRRIGERKTKRYLVALHVGCDIWQDGGTNKIAMLISRDLFLNYE